MTAFDCRSALPTISVPTIVIAADKDCVTISAASRTIAQQMPNAELWVLKDTRHMGFQERRHEFAEAVRLLAMPQAGRVKTAGRP